ncbi:hypothetical protein [Lacticaseibacillus sp. N501-2]|uniref:hypothetical protein n=1 Tax=Lacticaseibacillus salsurae TaxID=3367729 RepID=UPI0038B406DF
MSEISHTSRGWLAFFGLIDCVLLVMFAVSLGMTLTLGTPKSVSHQLQSAPASTKLHQTINTNLVKKANLAGIELPANPQLVSLKQTKQLTDQAVMASADFQKTLDTTALVTSLTTRINQQAAKIGQHPGASRVKQVTQSLSDDVLTLMQSGWGAAYGMLVLMMQTTTIVTAVLGVIILLLMRLSAHSWPRFLRVTGRITYIIGIGGGMLSMAVAVPQLSGNWSIVGAPVGIVSQLIQAYAPLWQHVAGVVIVIGLVMAGLSYLFRNKQK